MFNHYGMLTRSNANTEFQESIKDADWSALLNELYISETPDFIADIQGAVAANAFNRSNFFMSLNYQSRNYVTKKNQKIPYTFATYGVKEKDVISRAINYIHQYLQKNEVMEGMGFFDYVFGTDYIQQTELQGLIAKNDIESRLRRELLPISKRVEKVDMICKVMERIWAIRSENSATRVVIVLENAETDSLDFLRQLYLLMPPRLRVETGFQTNVSIGDMEKVSSRSLPIFLMTISQSSVSALTSDVLRRLTFPVEFIDTAALDFYSYDKEKLDALNYHCSQLGTITDLCMGYAEKKIMQAKKVSYSSFGFYDEILKKTYSEDLLWWKNRKLATVDQLRSTYEEQDDLMEIPELREEGILRFYTDRMEEGAFADEIVTMITDESYPDRAKSLNFLRNTLYYGKEIDAIEAYAKKRDEQQQAETSRRDAELVNVNERWTRKFTDQNQQLTKEKEDAVSEAVKQGNERLQKLADEKTRMQQELNQQLSDEQKNHLEESRANQEHQAELERHLAGFKKQNEDLRKELAKYPGYGNRVLREDEDFMDYDSLRDKYNQDEEEIQNLSQKLEEEKEKRKKTGTVRNVLTALTVVFAVTTVGAAALAGLSRANTSNLESEKTALESEKVILESEKTTVESEKAALESEKTVLESEKSSLESENEDLMIQIEELQNPATPEFSIGTPEETEGQSETSVEQAESAYRSYGDGETSYLN